MRNHSACIQPDPRVKKIIEAVLDAYRPLILPNSKFGKKIHRALAAAFNGTDGLYADSEHKLPIQMITWRSLLTGQPDPTPGSRAIDIAVYHRDQAGLPGNLAALIEIESDLEDLWGSTSRSGFYTVLSLAKNADARHFTSYKSFERMAVASLLVANPALSLDEIEALSGDVPADHNPLGVPIYLVTGWCRATDHRELEPRLRSLGAELISGKVFPDRKSPRAFKQLLPR